MAVLAARSSTQKQPTSSTTRPRTVSCSKSALTPVPAPLCLPAPNTPPAKKVVAAAEAKVEVVMGKTKPPRPRYSWRKAASSTTPTLTIPQACTQAWTTTAAAAACRCRHRRRLPRRRSTRLSRSSGRCRQHRSSNRRTKSITMSGSLAERLRECKDADHDHMISNISLFIFTAPSSKKNKKLNQIRKYVTTMTHYYIYTYIRCWILLAYSTFKRRLFFNP